MRMLDAAPAVVMLAVSATIIAGTRGLPYWAEFSPGPAFAPYWIAGVTAVVAVLLLVQSARAQDGGAVQWPDRPGAARVILTVVALWLTVVLSPHLGIVATAVAFIVGMLVGILRRGVLASLATAVVTAGLIYGVFIRWLGVALPTGPWGF
jgi:putative tricarboxylic transport membrane protein